jgi:hypothetical protein
MNHFHPIFTSLRSFVAYEFSKLRMRALQDSFWAQLFGRNTELPTFPKRVQQERPNRKLIGVKDIPVENIVGTFGRQSDFDHKFRPRGKHLNDRWVNAYLSLERDGWSPIIAHKVGEDYYVEDGHHRVSVAHSLGMASIEAKIWEYSTEPAKAVRVEQCHAQCVEKKPATYTFAG